MSKRFLAKAALGTAVITASGGVGLAFALWSATGSGEAQSKALTASALTASAATATADLYPGFTGGDVYFTVANPNPYAVTISGVSFGAITSSDGANCAASNVSATNKTGLTISVPANATAEAVTVQDAITMASTAGDGCQGVSFTAAVTISGTQS